MLPGQEFAQVASAWNDQGVDVNAELVAPCSPEELFRWVEDLTLYPRWLDIVPKAEPAGPHAGDAGPAWDVTLRGSLGPFARAKRLRMVRTVHQVPHTVQFERVELDGRDHAAWVLKATVTPGDAGSQLSVDMHYGGMLGGPPVEKLLARAIEDSRHRLLSLVTTVG